MSDAKDIDARLDRVYATGGDRDALDKAYDDWARDYDRDVWSSGNPYIAIISGMAGRYIPDRSARILDSGCGTGNMAEILHKLGYDNIVGIDASDGMLAAAEIKGHYAGLHKKLLGAEIDLPGESFDAVIAAGVLSHGHAPPDSLDGLLGVARPGAPVIFSISEPAMDEGGYREKIEALTDAGAWAEEEISPPFQSYPFSERHADLRHWVMVFRKAS